MTVSAFDESLRRIMDHTGTRTQVELASILGIKQSSISDAKKRQSVPAEWLLKLYRSHNLNPDWITTGEGPRFLAPADERWEQAGQPMPPAPPSPTVPELMQMIKDLCQPQKAKVVVVVETSEDIPLPLPLPDVSETTDVEEVA